MIWKQNLGRASINVFQNKPTVGLHKPWGDPLVLRPKELEGFTENPRIVLNSCVKAFVPSKMRVAANKERGAPVFNGDAPKGERAIQGKNKQGKGSAPKGGNLYPEGQGTGGWRGKRPGQKQMVWTRRKKSGLGGAQMLENGKVLFGPSRNKCGEGVPVGVKGWKNVKRIGHQKHREGGNKQKNGDFWLEELFLKRSERGHPSEANKTGWGGGRTGPQ